MSRYFLYRKGRARCRWEFLIVINILTVSKKIHELIPKQFKCVVYIRLNSQKKLFKLTSDFFSLFRNLIQLHDCVLCEISQLFQTWITEKNREKTKLKSFCIENQLLWLWIKGMALASADSSGGVIETTGFLGCSNSRLTRLELIQQHYHQISAQSQPCEHNCMCVAQPTATGNLAPSQIPFNPHHHHHPITQQHIHPHSHYHHQHDSNLVYNNSSTNSDCNQATNDSGCSHSHYVPTSNISVASQNLNIPNLPCDCGSNCQTHHGIHHPRQQSMEQQSLQSGRSSRIVSCDENNPSGTEDGSGMSSSGMMGGRRSSKRNL